MIFNILCNFFVFTLNWFKPSVLLMHWMQFVAVMRIIDWIRFKLELIRGAVIRFDDELIALNLNWGIGGVSLCGNTKAWQLNLYLWYLYEFISILMRSIRVHRYKFKFKNYPTFFNWIRMRMSLPSSIYLSYIYLILIPLFIILNFILEFLYNLIFIYRWFL